VTPRRAIFFPDLPIVSTARLSRTPFALKGLIRFALLPEDYVGDSLPDYGRAARVSLNSLAADGKGSSGLFLRPAPASSSPDWLYAAAGLPPALDALS